MAQYPPPSENLPIFDTSVFNDGNNALTYNEARTKFLAYPIAQGTETLQDITVNGTANFNNDVSFNYLNTPPHCSIPPTQSNDLCNKAYVDAQSPLTAYQLFCNYTSTFTTPTPTTYKLLSSVQDINPTTLPFTITSIGNQYITGFFNLISTLQLGTTIPAGNWTFNCYANVTSINDQSHVGIFFTIVGVSSGGVETVIGTSALSSLITVVSPAIGLYSMIITLPSTNISSYVDLGVKIYINSNVGATRTGNIFFQNTNSYTSVLTSYAVLVAPNILTTNNAWTGTNNFNNSVIVNTASPSLNPYMSITSTPQSIQLYPNSIVGSYNPLISANDNAIYGLSSSGIGTAVLDLTTYSATTSGVKINNNSVLIGAGGSTSTPTNSTTWSTSGVNTVSPICPYQSGYTVPLASDSSTNIATSAWTQSAILGLLSKTNIWTASNTFNTSIIASGGVSGTATNSNNVYNGWGGVNVDCPLASFNTVVPVNGYYQLNSYTGSPTINTSTGAMKGSTLTLTGLNTALSTLVGSSTTNSAGQNNTYSKFTGVRNDITNNATAGSFKFFNCDGSNNSINTLTLSTATNTLSAVNNVAPTATAGDNSTTIATTAFVTTAIAGSVGTATNVNVVNQTATAGNFDIAILQGVSGALPIGASTGITYNNTLGTITCNNFAGTATNATNVGTTSDNTSGTYYPTFVKTSGNAVLPLYKDDGVSAMTYNPFTSTLSTSNISISGAITLGTNSTYTSTQLGYNTPFIDNHNTNITTGTIYSLAIAIPSNGVWLLNGSLMLNPNGACAMTFIGSGFTLGSGVWDNPQSSITTSRTMSYIPFTLNTSANPYHQFQNGMCVYTNTSGAINLYYTVQMNWTGGTMQFISEARITRIG